MLRKNPEAFNTFVEVFVSVVIGRVRYSQFKFLVSKISYSLN